MTKKATLNFNQAHSAGTFSVTLRRLSKGDIIIIVGSTIGFPLQEDFIALAFFPEGRTGIAPRVRGLRSFSHPTATSIVASSSEEGDSTYFLPPFRFAPSITLGSYAPLLSATVAVATAIPPSWGTVDPV
jgi:hypothetical protein